MSSETVTSHAPQLPGSDRDRGKRRGRVATLDPSTTMHDTTTTRTSTARVSIEQAEAWALSYLRHAPLSLCLRELNRLLAMVAVDAELGVPPGPVLDVGCGD